MKCRLKFCPNLLKGQFAKASIYDERRAKKDKLYKGPELHPVCLECYKTLELNKYTLVYGMPASDAKHKLKRVPRTDEAGIPENIPIKATEKAPIFEEIPEWARGVVGAKTREVKADDSFKMPTVRKKGKTALESLPPKFGRAE